jgi:hypothetical protein
MRISLPVVDEIINEAHPFGEEELIADFEGGHDVPHLRRPVSSRFTIATS